MEIHAPDKPILTLKEFGVHLFTVTVGILIALSLEGLVEWRHHRALVREARANIATEMRDNERDLRTVRSHTEAMIKKLAAAAEDVAAMSGKPDPAKATTLFATPGAGNVMYGYDIATLNTASYATAAATGALGYMDYAEVKRYAEVYTVQEMYMREQSQAADAASTAISLGLTLLKQQAPNDIEAVRRQLSLATGGVFTMQEFGDVLLRKYERALNDGQ